MNPCEPLLGRGAFAARRSPPDHQGTSVQTAVSTGPVRIGSKAGIMLALGLTGAAGTGMILIAPGRPEIGWMVVAAAVGGAMSLIRRHLREHR
jgi:hypothetical protein